jgi:hypothetical protein
MSAKPQRDHYIAKTYLRHFGDPSLGGRLHAYRKSGGSAVQPRPKDVCRSWGDDMNAAFLPGRAGLLGEYRAIFEPIWNDGVGALAAHSPTPENKFAIAGYLANLMTCTPTWRRIGAEIYNTHATGYLLFSKRAKGQQDGTPDIPDRAVEMFRSGELRVDHEPDFIKATVTRRLLDTAWGIFRQPWRLLTAGASEKFVTSDNPSVISYHGPGGLMTRYFPVTPDMCVEVAFVSPKPEPLVMDGRTPPWLSRPGPPITYSSASPAEVRRINRATIQNAEEMVFCAGASEAIEKLTLKFRDHGVYAEYVELPGGDGKSMLQGSILRVGKMPGEGQPSKPAVGA